MEENKQKFGFLHSTVDAFDTFLRVPGTVTRKGAHVRDAIDLKRVMILVVIALVPAALFGMWNVGYQHNLATGTEAGFLATFFYGFLRVLPLFVVSYVVGLAIEFAGAQIKGEEVNEGYLVSGFLIPLIVPVDTPLWMLAIAVAFAVVFGKEVFGGTGMNFLNPALLTRAFLFFSYPSKMSGSETWIHLGKDTMIDGATGATPLSFIGDGFNALTDAGVQYGTSFMAYYHLVLGGFAFGTVFMATDPVTSAQTETGKWIYGFLIGALCVTVRLWNPGYPEGMMLAILLMNCFAPLIDHYVTDIAVSRRARKFNVA